MIKFCFMILLITTKVIIDAGREWRWILIKHKWTLCNIRVCAKMSRWCKGDLWQDWSRWLISITSQRSIVRSINRSVCLSMIIWWSIWFNKNINYYYYHHCCNATDDLHILHCIVLSWDTIWEINGMTTGKKCLFCGIWRICCWLDWNATNTQHFSERLRGRHPVPGIRCKWIETFKIFIHAILMSLGAHKPINQNYIRFLPFYVCALH